MIASCALKVSRAKKHISEVNEVIEKRRPFRYIVESDYRLGQRSIGAERNHEVICDIALAMGDAIHNLRSALDHRVWELVSPHCGQSGLKKIQFPFTKSGSEEDIRSGFESRNIQMAPKEVWTALQLLKPFPGGNEYLTLIHELDVIDKHKLLIPTADYKRISSDQIRKFLPDFPGGLDGTAFGANFRDVVWRIPQINRRDRRAQGISGAEIKDIPINVELVIDLSTDGAIRPLMATLNAMTRATEQSLDELATL